MKGVSTVIATILMLMITIGLAGVAAGYIFGWFTAETAAVLEIDEDMTDCSGGTITVYIINSGTKSIDLADVTIGGTAADGSTMAGVACAAAGVTGTGQSVACTTTLTGAGGTNQLYARATGAKTGRGSIWCPS